MKRKEGWRVRRVETPFNEARRGEYLAKLQEQLATVARERDEALQVVAELQPEAVLEREAALLDKVEKAELLGVFTAALAATDAPPDVN